MNYNIKFTEDAEFDLNDLFEVTTTYKAPITATKYLKGLVAEIKKLQYSANSFPLCIQANIIQKYGYSVRRINYKRMAILYLIIENDVIILRIKPSSTITELF